MTLRGLLPLLCFLLLAPGCRSTDTVVGTPQIVPLSGGATRRLKADEAQLLATLERAVRAGDDELAERLVTRLEARASTPELRELAASYRRVLYGRRLTAQVQLSLRSQPTARPGVFRLMLDARHGHERPLRLLLPPGTLELRRQRVLPTGDSSRDLDTRLVAALSDLELAPGEARALPLLEYELEVGVALAVRESWRLVTLGGELAEGEERYPVAHLEVAPCERQRLAGYLPRASLPPEELLSYIARERIHLPALLERTVRIAPERRLETLGALEPVLEELRRERPEHFVGLAPALAWITRRTDPVGGWSPALRAQLAQRELRRGGAGAETNGAITPEEPVR